MRLNFKKIANDLTSHANDKGQLNFIFKTKIHAIIVFYVFGFEKITFEDLCKLTLNVASRTTIQSILNEGVKSNYFDKTAAKNDKRKKYYTCNSMKPSLEKWYKKNQEMFKVC